MTSPVRDIEIIVGKWWAAMLLFLCILGMSAVNVAVLFAFGKPDWRPVLVGYLGLILQGGTLLAIGAFISTTTKNQIIAGGVTFFVCLLLWLLSWFTAFDNSGMRAGDQLPFDRDPLRQFRQRGARYEGRGFLSFDDFLRTLHYFAIHGVPEVEGLT